MKILIVGASSGIGRKLAEYYAGTGHSVGIAARRTALLKEIKDSYPDRILWQTLDVSDPRAPEQFLELISRMGGADRIIYCSGAGKQNPGVDPQVEFRTTQVNVDGFLNIVATAYQYFSGSHPEIPRTESAPACKGGPVPHIVAISSVAAVKGLGVASSYSASKRFQITYMEALAQLSAVERRKIDFTVILPGFVSTDFIKGRRYPFTMTPEYAAKRIVRAIDRRPACKAVDWKWAVIVFIWKLIPAFLWRRMRISGGKAPEPACQKTLSPNSVVKSSRVEIPR